MQAATTDKVHCSLKVAECNQVEQSQKPEKNRVNYPACIPTTYIIRQEKYDIVRYEDTRQHNE